MMQGLLFTTQCTRNGGFKATICFYFAVALSVVESILEREQLHSFAIVGSVVEFDCIDNSSGLVDWFFEPFGTAKSYWIAHGNKTKSEMYRIKIKTTVQVALIIERVNLSSAGMYECRVLDRTSVQANLTVLDSNPQCNELQTSSSTHVLCSFRCAGIRCLELELMETDSWNMRCSSLNDSVECEFGGSCNWTMSHGQQSTVSIMSCVDGNFKCEWEVNHVRLYIKGTNKSIGGWRCIADNTSRSDIQLLPDGAAASSSISASAALLCVLVLAILIIFLQAAMYIRQKRKLDSLIRSRTAVPMYDYIDLEVTSPQNNRERSAIDADDQTLISRALSTLPKLEHERLEVSAHAQPGSQAKDLDPFYEKLQDRSSPSATQTYVGLTISTSPQ